MNEEQKLLGNTANDQKSSFALASEKPNRWTNSVSFWIVCSLSLFFLSTERIIANGDDRVTLQTLSERRNESGSAQSANDRTCEAIVERETEGMTYYATDLFGWSPFLESEDDLATTYRKRRTLLYSLRRSAAKKSDDETDDEKMESEAKVVSNGDDVTVAEDGVDTDEREVAVDNDNDDDDDDGGEKQTVAVDSSTAAAASTTVAATDIAQSTTTEDGERDTLNDEDDEETKEAKQIEAAAKKLQNRDELLFVPPDKSPYRYAYIDWLKPVLQDDPRMAMHINDADMVLFTDSFADANPYMAKFLHENVDEDEESRQNWWAKQKDNARVLAQNLASRMSKAKGEAQRAVAFSNFLFPSERFILREKDEIGVPEFAQVGSDGVIGDNRKNSNIFLAVTDVSPNHIWEKAYKTNGIAMLVPFTANSDIARASLKLKKSFFFKRERPEMFYAGDIEFLHEAMHKPMKKLIDVEGQNIHLGKSKSMNSNNDIANYAEGSLRSSFCWIPRSYDKARFETSTRVIDSIAAGCIPIVVVDSISESLPFKWAVDYKSFMLQVPEKIFAENPIEVANAVRDISPTALSTMRSNMLDARAKLVWNDRNDANDECDKSTGRCSLAPKLFLDEMLYRVKKNNAEIEMAMCDRHTDGDGSSDWVDGSVWSGKSSCAPWLEKSKLCKATSSESASSTSSEALTAKDDDSEEISQSTTETSDENLSATEEEQGNEEGNNNSFDINEELEAAISGKSRAEKLEQIEAEDKITAEKETRLKERKESERKQIEEALKRQDEGNYELREKTEEEEEEVKGLDESDVNGMNSSIEDEIAATVTSRPSAVVDTSDNADADENNGAKEALVKEEEEEEEETPIEETQGMGREDQQSMEEALEREINGGGGDFTTDYSPVKEENEQVVETPATSAQAQEVPEVVVEESSAEKTLDSAEAIADEFSNAADDGKTDSLSYGEELYSKLTGSRNSKKKSSTKEEDTTGIDLDAFETKKSTDIDVDVSVASRDDSDDGWSSTLDDESY